MTLSPAFGLLSARDSDVPRDVALCTVSKSDPGDDGGRALGVQAAAMGLVWVDRPYVTGNPEPVWLAGRAHQNRADGAAATQILNEPNLPDEGFQGGAAACRALYLATRAWLSGAVMLYPPIAPVEPVEATLTEWVDPDADDAAVHAYGPFDLMVRILTWYLKNTRSRLWVTECNPGAGNTFDLNAWAENDLRRFLDWCATQPRIVFVAYFAFRWDQSPKLPSSVDAAGTKVVDVLRSWRPPTQPTPQEPTMPDWCPFASPRPITVNFEAGRGGQKIQAIVDHVADGSGSLFGWFSTPAAEVSAHFWISRTGAIEQYRPLSDTCWANGPLKNPNLTIPLIAWCKRTGTNPNLVTVAIEHEGKPADGLTERQTDASVRLHRWLRDVLAIPLDRLHVLGHYQFDAVTRSNCPGPKFPWEVFTVPDPKPAPKPDVTKLRDQAWAIAEQFEKAGQPWAGQGIKAVVALSKGEK